MTTATDQPAVNDRKPHLTVAAAPVADTPTDTAPSKPNRVAAWTARRAHRTYDELFVGAREIRDGAVWHDSPTSIADLVTHLRSGEWVPGDAPLVEFLGRAYGYAVAVPATFLLNLATFILQRPGRLILAVTLAAIAWWQL